MAVFQNSNRDITTTVANGTGTLSVVGNLWTSANAYISGNLTVDGEITYINITELNVEDPIISMGRGPNNTPLTANDGKDRGDALWYYTTQEQTAFLGFKNSAGNLFAATNVTITNELVTVNEYGNFVVGDLIAENVKANAYVYANLFVGDLKGSVFADDSTVFFDAIDNSMFVGSASVAGNTISNLVYTNRVIGDLEGSVFADDSSLFFDATESAMFVGTASVAGNVDVGDSMSVLSNVITGNVYTNYLETYGSMSVAGSIDVDYDVNAAGNVYADYFIGNVIGNVTITGGNTEVLFVDGTSIGSNVGFTFNKTTNVVSTTGILSAAGNVYGGNVSTAGNVYGNNISITSNIVGGNVSTAGNVYGNNISATSNITAQFFNGGSFLGSFFDPPGNVIIDGGTRQITAGNIISTSFITAVGNISTGNYFIGNGRLLTGISNINNGTTSVDIMTANANVVFNVGDTSNVIVVANTGVYTSGVVSSSGNVIGGNVIGVIRPTAGTGTNGILFPNNPGGGTGDAARIQYYAVSGEKTVLEISAANDPSGADQDSINITATGGVGINNSTPAYTFDVTGNIGVSGLLTSAGNVMTGNYFIGNGSQLTGMYSNTNATSLMASFGSNNVSTTGNINAGIVSASGNITASYFFGNGSQLTGMYSNTNATSLMASFGSNTISTSGNITVGNISATGATFSSAISVNGNVNITGNINATGNLNYQNVTDLVVGDPLIYIGANNTADLWDEGIVASFNNGTYQHTGLARDHTDGVWKLFSNVVAEPTTVIDWANATYSSFKVGPITSTGLISATGNITGSYFFGNGSQLSGLPVQYSNSNVATFLAAFGSNTISTSGNITSGNLATGLISATGNITGSYFFGNGSQLTGLPVQYGNSNVATYLASGNDNQDIVTTANISGGNISTSGIISAGGNILFGSIVSGSGNITGGNIAGIIRPTGGSGVNGIIFPPDPGGGSGDLAWIKYYAIAGEKTVLDIGVSNDTADSIYLNAPLGVGINNTTPTATLDVTGNILASGDISAFSDARLKTDVETIVDPIGIIRQLRGVDYTSIESGDRSSGVIAQEIRQARPMLVRDNNGYLSVNYNGFAGLFIESIKSLVDQVEQLQAEVKRLKGE